MICQDCNEVKCECGENSIYNVIDRMSAMGGSFVKNLARLYRSADPINKRVIKKTFKQYFIDYRV